MSESNSADLQFKQKRFTVSIDSTYADSDSLKLYINGDEQSDFDEYESVTYGPYAPDEKSKSMLQLKLKANNSNQV